MSIKFPCIDRRRFRMQSETGGDDLIQLRFLLLLSLLRPNEDREPRLIPRRLQDVNLTLFDTLEAGDILFVDSSHVVKARSDVSCSFLIFFQG